MRLGWRRGLAAAALALPAALSMAACAGGAPAADRSPGAPSAAVVASLRPAPAMSPALAAEIARRPVAELVPFLDSADAGERRIAVRALGRAGGDDAAQAIAPLLRDPDAAVRVEACFAIGMTGSEQAAALLGPIVEAPGASRDELAAAAAGIAHCKDDAAGDLLVRLCLREGAPVEAPEALFRYARWRGRPWPGGLPDTGLLRWEKHAEPRGRAAIGWFGRVWKDPQLLPALARLTFDADPEVRRAAILGLADGKGPTARPAADADLAMAAIAPLEKDADWRVVVCAARAATSYDRPDAVALLRRLLAQPSFHVRTAVCEGLGARKAAEAFDDLLACLVGKLVVTPGREGGAKHLVGSPSVRYAAASAAAAIDPKRAQRLVDTLLSDPSEFVQSAGAEILAKSEDDAATARLAALASAGDRPIRVRESALDGLKEKKGDAARAAVVAALRGTDPVLVSVAADVAATNGWADLAPEMRAALPRHPGTAGADAREGIVGALAKFALPEDLALISRVAAEDPDAGPRGVAQAAFAERAGVEAPPPDRLPRAEGAALPLGARLLARDVLLVLETDQGTMTIRLDASEAPIHSSHIADLARRGLFDGLTWHRVVPDFVIQGGCPRGDGAGNAGVALPLESTRTPYERGTLGMPRSGHPDTGGCQLFICHSRAPHLDVEYTAFGQVVDGLDVIDRIDVDSKIVRARIVEPR